MTKSILFTAAILLSLHGQAQSVGINNPSPDNSAQLDITSSTRGLLIPRMTQAQRLAISNPANALLVYQTDGQFGYYFNTGSPALPTWTVIGSPLNTWAIGGNTLNATGNFGSLSNNNIDLITNGITRGRLSNLGEFFIGTTNTVIAGDLMGVVSNSTYPFAVNGFSSFNGSGVYGTIQGGNTNFAAVQGDYASTTAGTFNTAGVRGNNQSTIPGTGFRTQLATGPRVGVIGNTSLTSGQYTFGVHGSMGSTDTRCGGIIGDDFGIALAALGYFAANLVDYSVYGFGGAYQSGVAGGRTTAAPDEPNTHIGLGIYGGVMGGWMRGLVYGTYIKGDRYSLYVDGKTYTNEPIAELIPNADGSRTPAYAVTAPQPEIYAHGRATLQDGQQYIAFSKDFSRMAGMQTDAITITVSPLGSSMGVYIAAQDARGFWVKENNNGKASVDIAWIAIAKRKGFEQLSHAPELLTNDFDRKMNGVMFNDNNKTDSPQPLWWDGRSVRFDTPPAKNPDPRYQPVVRAIDKPQQ